MAKFLTELRKTTGSVSFEQSKYGEPEHYINTGSFALNRICSGDLYLGIPAGRTVILFGPTGVGKTLIALKIAANALTENKYDIILYFDSEGGAPKEMISNLGCDPSKVEQILIDTVEDATVKILSAYQSILAEQEKNPKFRALLIVDSLGALVASKLYSDIDKGDQKHDQGNRARLINAMVKGCTIPSIKSNCSIIFLNHVYDCPAQMHPTKIKEQSGGQGLQYMASLSIQCTRKLEKSGDSKSEEFYNGTTLRFFTTKNRIVRPFIETEIFVDFSKGICNPYDGLMDLCLKYGLFIQDGHSLSIPLYSTDKKFKKKEVYRTKEIWDKILPVLNEKSKADLKYSVIADSDLITSSADIEDDDEDEDNNELKVSL